MRPSVREVLPGQHRAFGRGAMTAALVIVPVKQAGGARTTAGELPWMVRLSTGAGDITTALPRPGSPGLALVPEPDAEPDPEPAPAARRAPVRLASVPSYRSMNCAF